MKISKTLLLISILLIQNTLIFAKWHSFEEGLSLAIKQKKPMLVDFYTNWCHWCKVMDEKTFNDPTVKEYLSKNFITARILADSKTDSTTYINKTYPNNVFTSAMGITGFPSLVFFDKNGKPLTKIPGYIPPEKFINILKYIHKELYLKNINFEDYLNNPNKY